MDAVDEALELIVWLALVLPELDTELVAVAEAVEDAVAEGEELADDVSVVLGVVNLHSLNELAKYRLIALFIRDTVSEQVAPVVVIKMPPAAQSASIRREPPSHRCDPTKECLPIWEGRSCSDFSHRPGADLPGGLDEGFADF